MIRLLIVDDDKLARKGLVSLMNWEHFGITVVGDVQNGKLALQFIQENPVDLVFVDIDMPEMNGITFMEECRKLKPEIQFVVLSFFEDFSYVQATLRLGGLDYISKTSMELDHCDEILQRIVEKYEAGKKREACSGTEGDDLGGFWEICKTKYWVYSDQAFGELKDMVRSVSLNPPSVRRLEMMVARCVGELEKVLELPETMVPLFSETEEVISWLTDYRESLYESLKKRAIGSDAEQILKSVSYMKEHLAEDLSTGMMAEYIGCSRSYFCSIFKKYCGVSFGDFLQQMRIEYAKKLLRDTEDSVTEISFLSGYNDIYYFNRVFRKSVGQTPTEYRKNHRE